MDLNRHVVCIFGGGVAGSEAASQFVARGVRVVVFEQNALPWGKIEYGLPRWHVRQRDQEEAGIDERLNHPQIEYVPNTGLGRDLSLDEVLRWGFSAVILAVGAWKDRPLEVPGIEELQGRGFYYQNPFVHWFNESSEPDYSGNSVEMQDGAIVVGGGLASIDVAKILMIETTRRALASRGFSVDVASLEKTGIPKTLQSLGVTWEQLEIQGCTLYYRRRAEDMPLVPPAEDGSFPANAETVRKKLLQVAQGKYLFKFEGCSIPTQVIIEKDHLAGLVFRRTAVESGRVRVLPGTEFEVRSPMVVSSIGSLPEPIGGLPFAHSVYSVEDAESGRLAGFDRVFVTGNAVTGKGNIRASRLEGRRTAEWIIEHLATSNPGTPETVYQWVRTCQARVGYDGDYQAWVARHRPVRPQEVKPE